MTEIAFSLGTFRTPEDRAFVGLVRGGRVTAIDKAVRALGVGQTSSSERLSGTMVDLLEDWDKNFDALLELARRLSERGDDEDSETGFSYALGSLAVRPPVLRPSKILNSAANFSGHLAEMRGYTQSGGNVDAKKIFRGDKENSKPYLFFKAPSALVGAYDDVVLPAGAMDVDWEAEMAVVIGRRTRSISASQALSSVAGYMTFNDVSCRTTLFREDRPNFRTDWMYSKSFDTFAPAGPFLVPRAFVPSYETLRIKLWVNGELKQDGLAGDMIFSPEEQIEFASAIMTLEPGDIFVTGTVGGVGQGSGKFLKAGDILETEIEGLGRQRNRVTASA